MHRSKHGKQMVSLENTRTHPELPSKGAADHLRPDYDTTEIQETGGWSLRPLGQIQYSPSSDTIPSPLTTFWFVLCNNFFPKAIIIMVGGRIMTSQIITVQ